MPPFHTNVTTCFRLFLKVMGRLISGGATGESGRRLELELRVKGLGRGGCCKHIQVIPQTSPAGNPNVETRDS